MAEREESLLIGCGARFYRSGGTLHVEAQTGSGLRGWQQNFGRVVAFGVCLREPPPVGWSTVEEAGLDGPEFEFIELPNGYDRSVFLRARSAVRKILLAAMKEVDYRVFSFGGWIGDWGVTAADLARKNNLSHAVWLDRVESNIALLESGETLKSRVRSRVMHQVIAFNERRALAGAELALLHGKTVYDKLHNISPNAHVAEDIHVVAADAISAESLQRKLTNAATAPALHLVYVGRADPMKGPQLWVDTLLALSRRGVDFEAHWIGDGSELGAMKEFCKSNHIEGQVKFHGFVFERDRVLSFMRDAHLFLFCHVTDESPRNLIEALHSGLPLIGFADSYAENLVAEKGAGTLVPRGDVAGLSEALTLLANDRARLVQLIESAAESAHELTHEKVFAHRSAIVRQELGKRMM